MTTVMRAKLKITNIVGYTGSDDDKMQLQVLHFSAVGPSGSYPADGSDENNTFAKWTPNAELSMSITNPALFDQFSEGEEFYVDFTKAE